MSITDELRMGGIYRFPSNRRVFTEEELTAIADRIDAEHERELRETGEDIVRDVRREWVRLPLDADGVPIRVGDVLTDGEYTFVVDELAAFGNGSWSIRSEGENAWKACDVTHHHKPTVEDVLREFAEKMAENTAMYVAESWDANERDEADAAAIAEYAAKLRLVEEGA